VPVVTDLTRLSAREAARRIAAGALTAERYVGACLERIAEREAVVGAWQHLDPEQALAEARARDRATKKGPLQGVPIGVKDVMDTADMPSGYGSPIYAGNRPSDDAACVALARAAGAVVMGKTVTTEFATFTPGKTANPHNLKHTPGGSSSGSAAAVGDFMVPLAFGTQTAGSVIRPASYCGVVGYKPSFGTIARAGVKQLAVGLDTVGAMARQVEDVAFFAGVLSDRPALVDLPKLEHPRLALCRTAEWPKATAATEAALDRAVAALRRAGTATVEIDTPERHRTLLEAQVAVMGFETPRALAYERLAKRDLLSPKLAEMLEDGLKVTAAQYDATMTEVRETRRRLPEFFGAFDAVLVPAAPGEAPEGLAATGDPVFNRVWTLLHVPCVTIPAGTGPQGLPVGVQLVGRIGDDARVLAAARFLEAALAG
jgi:Asp-tRNA(Asn)/Glu-tRNA(Gln) amidotransferase A subunit family amidase